MPTEMKSSIVFGVPFVPFTGETPPLLSTVPISYGDVVTSEATKVATAVSAGTEPISGNPSVGRSTSTSSPTSTPAVLGWDLPMCTETVVVVSIVTVYATASDSGTTFATQAFGTASSQTTTSLGSTEMAQESHPPLLKRW